MKSVPGKRPIATPVPALTPPTDAIERGWHAYSETVVPASETDSVRFLLRLAYYAGASQGIGALLAEENEAIWPQLAAALALEVCNATDDVVLDAMFGRRPQ